MIWAIPTWGAMAARSRRRISIGWPTAACGSRSFTTRPAAGRRAARSSPATTRSRSAATRFPVSAAAQGKRPPWAPLVTEYLKPLGYRTYHSGKWHVDGRPLANGFDHSYLVEDQDRYFSPRSHFDDDRKLPPVEPDSGYYATVAIADHAVRCLREHAEQHAARPFFSYLAFTCPHFPLQALPEDIARYRDHYARGLGRASRRAACADAKDGVGRLPALAAHSGGRALGFAERRRTATSGRFAWRSTRPWSTAWTARSAKC